MTSHSNRTTTAADRELIHQASALAAAAIESHETEIAGDMAADLAGELLADATAPAGSWIVYRTSIDIMDGCNRIGSPLDGLSVPSLLFATVRQEAGADPAGAAPFFVEIGFWPNTAEPHQEIERLEQHRIAPVSRHAAIEFTDHAMTRIASEMAG